MTDFLDDIVESSPEMQRLVTEETFILDTIEEIYAAMEKAGISKTDLARELNTSLANVSQKLRGTSNLTLRTVAAISHAMNLKPTIKFEDPHVVNGWGQVYVNHAFSAPGKVQVRPGNDERYDYAADTTATFEELLA